MAQRPYSTLHSPDDVHRFNQAQASQYSLHTPTDVVSPHSFRASPPPPQQQQQRQQSHHPYAMDTAEYQLTDYPPQPQQQQQQQRSEQQQPYVAFPTSPTGPRFSSPPPAFDSQYPDPRTHASPPTSPSFAPPPTSPTPCTRCPRHWMVPSRYPRTRYKPRRTTPRTTPRTHRKPRYTLRAVAADQTGASTRPDKSAIRTSSMAERNTTTASATASVTFQPGSSPLCSERAFVTSTDLRAHWLATAGRRIAASCARWSKTSGRCAIGRMRGGGLLGPVAVLWGMGDIGGKRLWFMGEVSCLFASFFFSHFFPIFFFEGFALVMGYFSVACVFSVSFFPGCSGRFWSFPIPLSFFFPLHHSVLFFFGLYIHCAG
ncbi:unnamed protein product [Tuber aestivum]|uniref:Uncharacterized protein n=1 Tax=Tuber aestivum TaxID=59557 RepID=A0A292Q6L6_9PEZI|nr:unnamed protein product [Tuber aestivum]